MRVSRLESSSYFLDQVSVGFVKYISGYRLLKVAPFGVVIGSGGPKLSDIFLPFLKVFPSSHVDLRFLGFRFLQFPAYHHYRLQCLALHFPFSQEVLSVNSRLLI